MQSALRSVPGVESASVDFEGKTATVTCHESCDEAALIAALKQKGYDGHVR